MQPIKMLTAVFEHTTDTTGFFHPIEFLRGENERQRWFCDQLVTLSDDIWQLGHEKLAASLLDFAIVDIANNMEDESELLVPALLRCCVLEDGPGQVVTEMLSRHQGTARANAFYPVGLGTCGDSRAKSRLGGYRIASPRGIKADQDRSE